MGALSDRIGRKWIMMAGCLLAAVSYMPIYQRDAAAAGSNVVTAIVSAEPVTGAISLDPANGSERRLQPAKEVLPYTDFASLLSSPIALETHPAGVYSGVLRDDGLWPDRGVSGRGVSGKDQIHVAYHFPITSATASSAGFCQ